MDLSSYDAQIARLESAAERSPTAYRWRVGLIACAGYAAIVVVLVVGLALMGAAIGMVMLSWSAGRIHAGLIKLAFVLLFLGAALSWSVLRGVWVRFPPAPGIVLRRDQAPDLFAEVESLRLGIGAPPVHRIVINSEFNAGLAQRPRLGIFGWYQNQLVLGMPLLRHMSVEQARSVIAHELGHLHGAHGRFGAWIHRLRSTWGSIATQGSGGSLANGFLSWYAPRFNAYSFVLARMQEREADRAAAHATSPTAAASALVRCAVIGRNSAGFWQDLGRASLREAKPPEDLLDRLDRHLATPSPHLARWVGEELNRDNDREDVHPCLRERLEIIGCPEAGRASATIAPMIPSASAAHAWLHGSGGMLAATLNREWAKEHTLGWTMRHREGTKMVERLTALLKQRESGTVSIDERWELVQLARDIDGPDGARPLIEELLTAKPDHAHALFMLGHDLLQDGDERGVPVIERAMKLEPDAVTIGCALLRDFAATQGKRQMIAEVEKRAEERSGVEAKAAAERGMMPAASRVIPHGLDAAGLAPILKVLSSHNEIASADFAGVRCVHLPEKPHFVLVVRVKVGMLTFRGEDADNQLLNTLANQIAIPGSIFLINGTGNTAALAKAAAGQSGSRIYSREK